MDALISDVQHGDSFTAVTEIKPDPTAVEAVGSNLVSILTV